MTDIWFISDTHFNHSNILNFTDSEGKKFRGDIFSDTEHMNETMIENWNKMVKPTDKIYHLGDVYFGNDQAANNILRRLNGHKRLIIGNHDKVHKKSILLDHFDSVKMWWPFEGMIFTHVPIPRLHMRTRSGSGFNFHGHTHQNPPATEFHFNLSVERINFTPIHLDELKKIAKIGTTEF